MPLTDTSIRNAKPAARRYKLSDGNGLQLHVMPQGSKLWRLAYRYAGKQRELSIGAYPVVTLLQARRVREEARELLAQDLDPGHEKKTRKALRDDSIQNSFEAVSKEFIAKLEREGRAEQTLHKSRWILEKLTFPYLGSRPIADISAWELLEVLRKVEARGRFETAGRMRQTYSQVFRYAVATGRAERDVTADLRGALTVKPAKPRAALLDSQAVGQLLRAISGYEGQATTLYALRMAPYVFVRPIELRYAEWTEFDIDSKLWRIPAQKMKSRLELIVPLSSQVMGILNDNRKINGSGKYLFPSLRDPNRPISENTMNAALRRLGYSKDEIVPHGFRRIASTFLNEKGFNRDWIERQLAHVDGEVRGIYNAAQYLEGRTQMMQWWADHLDGLQKSLKS